MQNDIVTLLSLVPAAIFAAATFLYFADLEDFQRLLADWGYAPRSHVLIGGLTVVATTALAVPEIRVWGVIVAALLLVTAAVVLVQHRRDHYALWGALALATLPLALP